MLSKTQKLSKVIIQMSDNYFYSKQKKFHIFIIMLCFTSKFAFAWSNFEKELRFYLTYYKGAPDQYIKNKSDSKGYFVPANKEKINKKWFNIKEQIRCELGDIKPKPNAESLLRQNSADTSKELYKLAHKFSPDFKKIINDVVNAVPSASHSNYKTIVKSKSSIENKVNRDKAQGVDNPVKWIGDTLRTTIFVDTSEQFRKVIEKLNNVAQQNNYSITYKNIFEQNYKSGYVGVHAILHLSKEDKSAILSEVQIHFRSINDGTEDCPKEYTHGIYEITKDLQPNCNKICNATSRMLINLKSNGDMAQKIVYTFGLDRIVANNYTNSTSQCTIPDDDIVTTNNINYYFTMGFLLKTKSNGNKEISTIQLFNANNNAWEGPYYNGNTNYQIYLSWIQNEDGSSDNVEEDLGDDSLRISESVAKEIQQVLLKKAKIEHKKSKAKTKGIFTKFLNWLCRCTYQS
ncbi:MAG: hypothetical protein HRU36_00895 [Rickettsiales bacterium]|nr:hypothetical protein [Rickettsiales bacterium]